MPRGAHPGELPANPPTAESPASASFHRQLAEEPKNAGLLQEALYEVTGRRLALAFAVGANGGELDVREPEGPLGEDELFELVKETFDARDVEE